MRSGSSHRVATAVLVVLASVLTVFSIYAVWLRQQVLDGPTWATTSTELVRDPQIAHAVSGELATRLVQQADVRAALAQLPGTPTGQGSDEQLRGVVDGLIYRGLQTTEVQRLWRRASVEAQHELIRVLDGRDGDVSVREGRVTLDLRALVRRVGAGIGLPAAVLDEIPRGTTRLEILRSGDLALAQDTVKAIRGLSLILPLVTILLWLGALLLARRRRLAVAVEIGLGLAIAGLAVIVTRTVGGNALVDRLARDTAYHDAADRVWLIGTSLLRDAGLGAIVAGVVLMVAAGLAGLVRRRRA